VNRKPTSPAGPLDSKAPAVRPPADLGILGGMGPQATHYFTDELLTAIEARHRPRRDQDYPSIFVRYACHLPDRTSALLTDREPLVRAIVREAEILVELGCSQILMPCITAHALLDSELSGFPFIDVRKVVATHIASSFARATVGILATRGARLSGVNKLLPNAQKAVLLEDREEEKLMHFIYGEAKTAGGGKDISTLRDLANRLRQRGGDVIIAGCTEVEMCLARDVTEEDGFLFPLRTAARFFAAAWSRKTSFES
jgi:aspartate racemase